MNGIGSKDTVGIDLGDRFSYACVLGPEGNPVGRFRLRTTRESFQARFAGRPRMRAVIETGTHSPWVSRMLRDCGHEVIVANARRVALIGHNKKKTDREDCELLARIGRVDPALLAPIEHRGEQSQLDLAVLRARSTVVRARAQLINSARGLVKSIGKRLPACGAATFHKVARKNLPEELAPALDLQLELIERHTEAIKAYDKQIEQLCQRHQAALHLQAVQGVGPITSLAFVLTIEDPRRFRRSRQVGAYLGLVPKLDESGDSKPQLRITKAGDVDLRSLLVTSAQYVLGPWGPDSDLRRWGLNLAERGGKNGKKRAVVAVARRLAVLLHKLWVTGEVYDPLYLARRAGQADDPDKARPPRARRRMTQCDQEQLAAVC